MRFASHLDVARAFERGVRRAGVPIAYSAGFTPHPKISYAGGVPTGVASEAEYLSLALTSRSDPAAVRERLNAALPDGIEVIDVSEGAGGLPASQLVASEWQVILPGLPPRDVAPAVQEFLALEHIEVERLTSKGMRRMDARPAVVMMDLRADDGAPGESARGDSDYGDTASGDGASADATLRMIVMHTVPAVRPDDVLTAIREISGVTPDAPPLMTRLAQGSISESGVVMP
jgi:radical SAM-linked protein